LVAAVSSGSLRGGEGARVREENPGREERTTVGRGLSVAREAVGTKTSMGSYWDAEVETLPWAEVQAQQARRLVPWLRELAMRSGWHRAKLDGAPVPDEPTDLGFLASLPTTTKDEVRRSQADRAPGTPFGRHQAVPLEQVVQVVSSSGTTGDPVFFALTNADRRRWEDTIATVFHTAGVRPGDVVAHLVGLPGVAGGLPYADGFRRLGAALVWLGGLGAERIVRAIPRVQASVVLSTSSFGTYLADQCRDLIGVDASSLGVRNLLGGGEPGLAQAEIRQRIVRGWGLDQVHEIMGLGDVLSALWAECDEGGGMHFCGQRTVAVELLDPATGEQLPWEEGVHGEAVYTTIDREATPALRYRSADHLHVTAASCPCGRTSPRVRCVGRTDDMLIYKAMNVFPSAIRSVVLDRFASETEPYLRILKDHQDQVRFDAPIPVEVEADPSLSPRGYDDVARRIERAVREQLQVRVAATLVAPGTLPRSAYKTPLVHVREPAAAE
jgi:phenylacetate-coenzyme A ligase PaaK-like adenylate-forming protein